MMKKRLVIIVVLLMLLTVAIIVTALPPPPPVPSMPGGDSDGRQRASATPRTLPREVSARGQHALEQQPGRQQPALQQPSVSVEQQLSELGQRLEYLESTAGKFSTPVMVLLAVNMVLVGLVIYFLIIARPKQPSYPQYAWGGEIYK